MLFIIQYIQHTQSKREESKKKSEMNRNGRILDRHHNFSKNTHACHHDFDTHACYHDFDASMYI
jgi:hypothetical protein